MTNDAGDDVRARYTLSDASYFAPMLHIWRPTNRGRHPLYAGVGTVRTLVADSGTVTDTWRLDAFGEYLEGTGSSSRKYQYGGAWGYLNDPSGLQQLGARFYWPEIGRFISQDPIGDGVNWYAYVGNNPVVRVDPEGLVADTVVDAAFAAWDVGTAIKCPTWQNVGMAAVSVAAVAPPFVPNVVGYARHADDLADLAAGVNRFLKKRPPGRGWKRSRRGPGWKNKDGMEAAPHPAGPDNPHGDHRDTVGGKGKRRGKGRLDPDGSWEPKRRRRG